MSDSGNEFNLKFLEAYQCEPVIWDPAHTHHKDKKKVNNAWLRLSNTLDRPLEDLKRKKESLMATFRGHLRKKKASIRSGASVNDVYKPVWFAYEIMEAFLGPVYDCTPTVNTQEMTMPASPELSVSGYEESQGETRITTATDAGTSNASQRTVRRRKNPPELEQAGNQMREVFNTLNNVITQRTRQDEEDECDLFGKMLVKKLRKIPEHERDLVMYEIDGIFINRSNLNFTAFPPNSSSNPTYHMTSSATSSVSHSPRDGSPSNFSKLTKN